MDIPADMLRRLVTGGEGRRAPAPISPADADRIFEIAWLTVTADGNVADEEIQALRVVGGQIHALAGGPADEELSDDVIDEIEERAASLDSAEDVAARLQVLGKGLSSNAERHLAYKLARALMMSDLSVNDDEDAFMGDLLDALGISDDVAESLDAEVDDVLVGEED
jgi:hypothetical protein